MITCFAVWARMRPKLDVSSFTPISSPTSASGSYALASVEADLRVLVGDLFDDLAELEQLDLAELLVEARVDLASRGRARAWRPGASPLRARR